MSLSDLGSRTWAIREPGRPAIYRLGTGGLINALGSGATAVAFGFFLYDRTGSAVWLSAWYFFSFGITGVFTPVFGWLADRYDRQKLIIAANLGAAVCSLTLIVAHGPVALVSVAFVASIVGRAGSPSFGAALPNLVGDEPFEWANGTLSVAYNIGNLLGPILGGAVYVAAGRSVVFGFDAVTYCIAALTVSSLRIPFRASDEGDDQSKEAADEERRGVLRGFGIVFHDPILRGLIAIWFFGYFAVDITLVGDLPLAREFGAGALAFGVLSAAWGAGSIIGSLLGRRLREEQDALGISIGVFGIALAAGLIAISPWFVFFVVLSALVAVASGIEDVAGFSMIQRQVADRVRGRVMSTFGTIGLAANAVAFAIAGSLVELFGPRAIYAISAAASAACIPFLKPIFQRRRAPVETPGPL
jgi:MFS family permease